MQDQDQGQDESEEGHEQWDSKILQAQAAHVEMQYIDHASVFGRGVDAEGHTCLSFLPRLAFPTATTISNSNASDGSLILDHLTLKLFIEVDDMAKRGQSFSVLYGHARISTIRQTRSVLELHRLLPRKYKKLLKRIIVLHPTSEIRALFHVSSIFSSSISHKIILVENILEAQIQFFPVNTFRFPDRFLLANDLPPTAVTARPNSLISCFNNELGCPTLLHNCIAFLKSRALQHEG